jgi:hypothetical protein
MFARICFARTRAGVETLMTSQRKPCQGQRLDGTPATNMTPDARSSFWPAQGLVLDWRDRSNHKIVGDEARAHRVNGAAVRRQRSVPATRITSGRYPPPATSPRLRALRQIPRQLPTFFTLRFDGSTSLQRADPSKCISLLCCRCRQPSSYCSALHRHLRSRHGPTTFQST